jgi:preprotein translocase subunit SecG
VGIKKVLGGTQGQLFQAADGVKHSIIVVTAVVLALFIAGICLPFIKNIASYTRKI